MRPIKLQSYSARSIVRANEARSHFGDQRMEAKMAANLTYYIFEGVLTGIVDGRLYHLFALSGGGGGSTTNATQASANNPYMEGLKTSDTPKGLGHTHGGPIPPGKYKIEKP